MTDIPPEIRAEIERDVERYRNVRLAAARKRLTPEYLDKLARRTEYQISRDQIVAWFASGESIETIAATRFRFIKQARIKREIRSWLFDHLNSGSEAWYSREWPSDIKERYGGSPPYTYMHPPPYSDEDWRKAVLSLRPL